MSRKIIMLLNAPYPADIRVKKETDALIKAGHTITLLCLRRKNEPYRDSVDGISIKRIDAGKNNIGLAFWDTIMSISFIHPKFLIALKKAAQEIKPDAVHVHDLPLVGTALRARKTFPNLSVVTDFHENYPEALRTWFKWKKNPLVRIKNFLFMNPKRWTALERVACKNADKIIAVVEEMKERLSNQYQIPLSKITVVTNTEDKNFIHQADDPMIYQNFKNKFIMTYCGGIGPHRGVDTAIEAMSRLKAEVDIMLVIVGFGSTSVMDKLKSRVAELNLINVSFLGYQPFNTFYSYMRYADVNVIPHQANGHTNNTVPHKLFQGMMAGKPLLVSSCAPLKRIVEQYDSGIVFEAGNPDDFARQLKILRADSQLQKTFWRKWN
ncbi:MAG: glycosyltransferase family 4 protein [Flammeovirgaceae bacterium]|nr:glycosyltransferase family 4 protein [Flammeovirgaceae bacterium]